MARYLLIKKRKVQVVTPPPHHTYFKRATLKKLIWNY